MAELVEHVGTGLAAFDAGQIDVFELDGVIYHYHRAAQELWKLCAMSGERVSRVVRALEWEQAESNEPDWWEIGAPRGR